MDKNIILLTVLLLICLNGVLALTNLDTNGENTESSERAFFNQPTLIPIVQNIINHCLHKDEVLWCFKVQSSRLLGRALKFQNINIVEGVSLIKKNNLNADDTKSRSNNHNDKSSMDNEHFNANTDYENLSRKSLDSMLSERFRDLINSRQLQVSLPRLLALGKHYNNNLLQYLNKFLALFMDAEKNASHMDASEGRKKKDDQKFLGPFIAAVLLKTAILKMAYHSIAIVAGKALIVGKIALIISAIIGLKKLVSSDGGEKTTYEIVKHPQVSQSHTYSSSHSTEYDGGHDGGGGGGSYHRSMDDEMMMQDKAYNAWVPSHPAA